MHFESLKQHFLNIACSLHINYSESIDKMLSSKKQLLNQPSTYIAEFGIRIPLTIRYEMSAMTSERLAEKEISHRIRSHKSQGKKPWVESTT